MKDPKKAKWILGASINANKYFDTSKNKPFK